MKRNVLGFACLIMLSLFNMPTACSAPTGAFAQHYDAAQEYLTQGQYSSAIVEFRKALRINYMDNSARIGLINSF